MYNSLNVTLSSAVISSNEFMTLITAVYALQGSRLLIMNKTLVS